MQASTSNSSASAEYVSSFTAPAMPNLPKVAGLSPRKPGTAAPRRSPRTPLPPHKLAKLANALGVSTPLPASSPSPGGKRSFSGRSSEDRSTNGGESRSSTPATGVRPSPLSRYLIHVVPPPHFPHESESDPDSYASFRRGSLVPLHQTLQAQLSAIQKEFLLPTSQGLMLYLVGDAQSPAMHAKDDRLGRGPRISDEIWKWITSRVADEQQLVRGIGLGLSSGTSSPAPSERGTLLRTLSTSSRMDNSNSRISNFTTTYPLTPSPSSPSTASISSKRKDSPSRQPTTSSSRSETSSISNAASPDTPPTSSLDIDPSLLPGLHSPSLIPVLTKVEFDIDRRNGGAWYDAWTRSRRELRGRQRGADGDDKGKLKLRITVSSNKDAPFKIDVPPSPEKVEDEAQEEQEEEQEEQVIDDDGGYARLSESPEQLEGDEELTARVQPEQTEDDEDHDDEGDKSHSRTCSVDDPPNHTPAMPVTPDPLSDVFGSDDQTWSDMQSTRPPSGEAFRIRNGDLALDGGALSSLPPPDEHSENERTDDNAEVVEIWSQNSQPALNVPPPTPPRTNNRPSLKLSPAGGRQRPVPPPLTLPHSNVSMAVTAATPTISPFLSAQEADDSKLPYLNGSTDRFDVSPLHDESMSNESHVGPVRTDEKRGGGIYEDLDLDLDVSGYTEADVDIADPDATEADQIKFSSDLDVLEQNISLLSPKELSPMPLPDEFSHSARSPALKPFTAFLSPVTPVTPGQATFTTLPERGRLVPTIQQLQPARVSMEIEEDVSASPPTFRQPLLVGTPSPRADSFNGYASGSTAGNGMPAWPAVPFASAVGRSEDEPISPKTMPLNLRTPKGSPPRVMLNGQRRESPNGPRTSSVSSMSAFQHLPPGMSSESAARVRQHEEEYTSRMSRPGPGVLQSRNPEQQAGVSPVMPLSPDPFGRFPSSSSFAASDQFAFQTIPASPATGSNGHDDGFEPFVRPPSKTPSSRFSSDSVLEDAKEPPKSEKSKDRATLMSVKSIKKLWRKTNKPSSNNAAAIVNAVANAPLPMQPRQSGEQHVRPQTPFYGPRTPSQPSQPSRSSMSAEAGQRASVAPPMHRSNGSQSSIALLSQKEVPQRSAKSSQRDSGLDPFYFDQDSKYPVRRSPTPSSSQAMSGGQRSRTPSISASVSLSNLPPSPNLPQQQLQPTVQPASAPAPPEEKKVKTRKSFLRWKSGGSSSEGKEKDRQSVDSTSTSSSSAHDHHMSRQQKRTSRRPSMGDLRFSSTSSAMDIASPSVPQLPAEYRQSAARTSMTMAQHRQSVQSNGHRISTSTSSLEDHVMRPTRTSSLRRKPVPSSSLESNVSTVASSESIHTPVMGSISSTGPLIEEEDERNYEFIPSSHQKSGSLVIQPEIPVSAFQYE